MGSSSSSCWLTMVALRKEGVDRNFSSLLSFTNLWVALRKEGVDRNLRFKVNQSLTHTVALRKEGVDRNLQNVLG